MTVARLTARPPESLSRRLPRSCGARARRCNNRCCCVTVALGVGPGVARARLEVAVEGQAARREREEARGGLRSARFRLEALIHSLGKVVDAG